MMQNKKIIILLFTVIFLSAFLLIGCDGTEVEKETQEVVLISMRDFNECLAENGVVIYGSKTCPACRNLVETLGGYDSADSVYVECTENQQRCRAEAKAGFVPEIQVNGNHYRGPRTLAGFSEVTGCALPN